MDGVLEEIDLPGAEPTVDLVYGDSGCPGKVTEVVRGAELAEFAYDGSLLLSVALEGVLDETVAMVYNNNPTGDHDLRVDGLTYAGATEALGYDADGLLTAAGAFTISRNAASGLPETIGDGTVLLEPAFNGYGEMEALDMSIDSAPKAGWDLTFHPQTGEIEGKAEAVAGISTTYGYDYTNLGQLEEVVKNSSVVEEYAYDANGNREFQKVNGVERWLTYDDEDHLDKIYSDAAKTVLVAEYDYDVDGFLTAKTVGSAVTTYDYASTGELLEVVLSDATEITYSHDALGRRVAKAVDGVVVEKYLWTGMNQGLLAVYDGGDNLVLRFEYAGGRLPVAMTYSGSTYYLAYDQVGSLRAVFNGTGSKIHEITYDSFGNVTDESIGTECPVPPLGFAGGLHDRYTGLVRFGYRDYDPEVGRWTAKDPIGFAGGDVNLYGYVLADPISLADPAGLKFGLNLIGGWFGGFFEGAGEGLAIVGDALNPFEDYFADNGYYDRCSIINRLAGASARVGAAATWGVATGGGGGARGLEVLARGTPWGGTGSTLLGTARGGSRGLLNGNAPWGRFFRFGWSHNPVSNTRQLMFHGGSQGSRFHWHVSAETGFATLGAAGALATEGATSSGCECD